MFDQGRVAGFLGEHLFSEELQGIYTYLKDRCLYIYFYNSIVESLISPSSIHFGFYRSFSHAIYFKRLQTTKLYNTNSCISFFYIYNFTKFDKCN